jgi:lipopolysaccharide biosynthesis glycosyltransferase
MTINVTCNTDNNYVQHCSAMLCSLFENNKQRDIHVHLLSNDISKENIEYLNGLALKYNNKFTIYNVDDSLLDGVQYRKNRPLTKAAYYRILLSSIISPSIDKILYLDCDLIVLDDISKLYSINIDGYALAATLDATPWNSLHRYQLNLSMNDKAFCSGIMLINLNYWRKNKSEEKLLAYSKTPREEVYLHDQDSLNYVFRNQWFMLPPKWNKTPMSIVPLYSDMKSFDYYEYLYQPGIIHYAGLAKPWFNFGFPDRNYYLHYLSLSEFNNSIILSKGYAYNIKTSFSVIKYYLNRFIRPVIPDILEIIFNDICFILILLFSLVFSPARIKHLFLKRWLSKYNIYM